MNANPAAHSSRGSVAAIVLGLFAIAAIMAAVGFWNRVRETTTTLTQAQGELTQARNESGDLKKQLEAARKGSADLQKQLEDATGGMTRLQSEVAEANTGATRLKQQLDQAKTAMTQSKSQVEQTTS